MRLEALKFLSSDLTREVDTLFKSATSEQEGTEP